MFSSQNQLRLPPLSPSAAVRMLSVVAGYGGLVCLSMRWGDACYSCSLWLKRTDRARRRHGRSVRHWSGPAGGECLRRWERGGKRKLRGRRRWSGGTNSSCPQLQLALSLTVSLAASLVGCQPPPQACCFCFYCCCSSSSSSSRASTDTGGAVLTLG